MLTLALTPASISENGGVSSLTGSLSGTLNSEVTVQVETLPRGDAVAGDLTQTGATLTFAAGSTTPTGTVQFTAVNDDLYSGDRQFSVLTSVSGGVSVPDTALRLTVTDDEAVPELTVELAPASISENGGVSSLTASLSGAARFEVAVEVTAVAPRGSAAAEGLTRTGATLTFAAGSTTPTGTVQFTAVDNDVDDGDRQYSIRWSKTGSVQPVGATTEVLTVTDDDETVLTLALTPASISENGGVSSLTGSLSGTLNSEVTVQVETLPRGDAVAGDLTQTGATLTFAAGSTTPTGTVQFTAVNDDLYSGDRQFSVLTSVSGGVSVPDTALRLTITDDEAVPELTVELAPASISENGGVSSLTASLSGAARFEVAVEVTAVAPRGSAAAEGLTRTGATLTFAAGSTTPTGTVQFTAVDNDVDDGDRQYSIRWSKTGSVQPVGATTEVLTVTDDDETVLTLALTPASISENGGVSSLTGSLSGTLNSEVTVQVETLPRGDAVAGDLTQTGATLTFAAGSTTPTGTVQFTAVNDDLYSGDRQFSVLTSVSGGVSVPDTALRLTVTDDEAVPELTVELAPASISENGGVSSLTASLSGAARFEVAVEVTAVAPRGSAAAEGLTRTGATLTFAAGSTTPTGTVQFTAVDNDVDDGDRQYSIRWSKTGSVQPVGATTEVLTVTDDDETVLTLALTPASISENGGVSSLTGSLSGTLNSEVTVQVETLPRGDAVAGDLTQTGATLTFAAGSTTPTGTVQFTAVNDDLYSGDRQFSVLTSVSGGVSVPDTALRLTVTDDEAVPELTVELAPASISENGGVSSLTASLSGAARFEVAVEVTAVAPRGSAAAEGLTRTGATLTFAAGSTTPTGTVQFTAVDNDVDDGDRQYSIRWSKTGSVQPVGATTEVLTVTDDDETVLTLALTPASISENGGVSSLTGSLSGTLNSEVTVQVETLPRGDAVAGDLTQTGATLTFAAGSTTPTGTVQFTAVNDDLYSGDRQFSVLTSVSGGVSVPDTALRLTITDDEAVPELTVELAPASISENGGVSSLTASLSGAARFEVAVEVTAVAPRGSAAAEGLTRTGATLTFAAGSTTPTGTVQFTAVDNDVDDGDRQYSIRWSKTGSVQPVGATTEVLTVTDDDETVLTLALTPASISENGGVSSLTGSLSGTLNSEVTVQVETLPRGDAVAGDLTQTGATLTFAAGSTTPTGTVQFTAVNDDLYSGDRQFSVLTSVSGGVSVPDTALRLTITDDEAVPELTVELAPASISENGGVSSLTASLSGAARFEVAVEVTAVAPRGSAAAEGLTRTGATLTFAAGSTTPTGTVQFTAVDNDVDDGDRQYSIRWSKTGSVQPVGATTEVLTVTDDDETVLTLALTPASISENGGVSSLTGSLSGTLNSEVTVQVETLPRGDAVAGDLTQTGATLTFAAGSTTPTGTVQFTAVNDDLYSGDRQFSVLTSVSGGVSVPDTALRLTITDDEAVPELTVELAPASISENGGVSSLTASLSGAARFEVAVEVTAVAPRGSAAAEGLTRTGATLTFAAGSTTPTGTVQFTAVDNDVDDGDRQYSIRWSKTGSVQPVGATTEVLTVTDDDETVLTLALTPASISENGGVSSLTGSLSGTLNSEVTVQVETLPRGDAVAGDLTQTGATLTFAAGSTTPTGTVQFTAVNDDLYSGDRQFSVLTSVSGGVSVPDTALRLTITDDEAVPELTVELAPASISENGGVSSLTASLSGAARFEVAVEVTAVAPRGSAAAEGLTRTGATLTFAAGSTTPTGTVQFTAVDNDVDDGDRQYSIRWSKTGSVQPVGATTEVLTVTDDDETVLTLALTPASISENGGVSSLTGSLSGTLNSEVTVQVETLPRGDAVAGDLTQTGATLTFAAGSTTPTGTVQFTAVNDDLYSGDRQFSVLTSVSGGVSVPDTALRLTITDDEAVPELTVELAPASISENGGVSSLTASLSGAARFEVAVEVTAVAPRGSAAAEGLTRTGATLTFAAGSTTPTGTVQFTAVDNDVDDGDRQYSIRWSKTGSVQPVGATTEVLTVTDDDETVLTLALTPASISENGGVSSLTGSLSGTLNSEVTVQVETLPRGDAVAGDLTQTAPP